MPIWSVVELYDFMIGQKALQKQENVRTFDINDIGANVMSEKMRIPKEDFQKLFPTFIQPITKVYYGSYFKNY